VEVGLGGRLDSTNVLHPALAVITNIDLDHTDLLGDTLDAIAREKAGIIKAQTPALSGVTQTEARAAIAEVADDQAVPLYELQNEVSWRAPHADLSGSTIDVETPLRRYDRLRVSLAGAHQQANAVLALRAAELVVPAVQANPAPVHKGLRDVRRYTGFRGRLELLQEQPLIVLDVAHNPSGIEAALTTVGPVVDKQGGSLYVCLNAVRGKGLPQIADLLAARGAHVIPIPIDTKRAIPPDEIAETLRAHGVAVRAPRSLRQALIDFQHFAQSGDGLLLTGSHKMVEVLPDDVPFRE
jgi:dihydrofolate synthase/folylpolyglutamate synthase